jgi:DNA-binding NarL/FixJ family response regulator
MMFMMPIPPTSSEMPATAARKKVSRLILEESPDVVLLDLRLPELSGIEVMREVRPQAPQVRFLVLTTYDTDSYIAPVLEAGASGYLLKDALPEELADAVRGLMQGRAALEPSVAACLLERISAPETVDELSARELEVLCLLVRGESNRGVAVRLGLSQNTVKTHISNIFGKLQVQSRAEAVVVALRRGLVGLDEV